MNKFYKTINWPDIPSEYHITDEATMIESLHPAHPYPDYPYYRQYKYKSSELEKQLQPLFNFDITGRVFVQIVRSGIDIHKDTGRTIIYNYILETGGDNVYTRFFDEDQETELYKINIPKHTWHQLDVTYFHDVVGIEKDRVAISVYESFRT